MAYITNITFWRYGKNEGLTCTKCGAYIRNVYTVTYSDGFIANYGTECFDKLWKSGKLSKYGEKEFKKILKNIKFYNDVLATWQKCKTEQELIENPLMFSSNYLDRYNESEYIKNEYKRNAHKDDTFEEYRDYIINEFIPYRLKSERKELERFKKIDFKQLFND